MALVVDTGVLYAAIDGNDRDHERCSELLGGLRDVIVIPTPILVEVDQLRSRRGAPLGAWRALCREIEAGAYALLDATPPLVQRAAQAQARYADMPIGFVDAFVFVTCEVLGEHKVATLDHRHFSVLRTKGRKPLQLVPG